MSLRAILFARLPLLLGMTLLLAACGMKGDLYLETDEDRDKRERQSWISHPDDRRA